LKSGFKTSLSSGLTWTGKPGGSKKRIKDIAGCASHDKTNSEKKEAKLCGLLNDEVREGDLALALARKIKKKGA